MKVFLCAFYCLFIGFFNNALAITNSVPAESADFMPVVLIRVEAQDDSGDRVPGLCNATIVSDRELVTAAHCLTHAQLLRSREIKIEVGKYKYVLDRQGVRRRVGYANIATWTDLDARFLLPASVEEKLRRTGFKTVVQPNEDNAKIELSKPIDLLALGVSPISLASQGELREMLRAPTQYPLTVVSVNPIAEIATTDVKRMASLNRVSWNAGGWIESRSNSQVEPLDSGSPIFAKYGGAWRLVGVVKGHAKTFFSEWDVFSILPAR